MELAHGFFTRGTIAFITENERRDGKGSFLSVYIRYGADKAAVTKAKVWAKNYRAEDGSFMLRDASGAWAVAEVGAELTAWGTIGSYQDAEGNQRIGYVVEVTDGLEAVAEVSAEA